MKKSEGYSSKLDKYLALKKEAIAELLQERESLKDRLKQETVKYAKLLDENAKRLAELDHKVKDVVGGAVVGKSLRLDDETIKNGLRQILARDQLSIPSICQRLHIARSRFAAFEKKNKGFLAKKGKGKLTVYFIKNVNG
jgi:hypothetical protein